MLDAEGNVMAVLDWEICTLGDPLADLGLLYVYWSDPDEGAVLPQASPSALEGFPRRRRPAPAQRAGRAGAPARRALPNRPSVAWAFQLED